MRRYSIKKDANNLPNIVVADGGLVDVDSCALGGDKITERFAGKGALLLRPESPVTFIAAGKHPNKAEVITEV